MKVCKDELINTTSTGRKKVAYSIANLTEAEFKTICKALSNLKTNKNAILMLNAFNDLIELSEKDLTSSA